MSDLAMHRISENIRNKHSVLDLKNCGLFNPPSEITKCVWLKELNLLGNRDLYDLSFVKKLKNLQKLDVSGTKVVDLAPLQELTDLQYLDISNTLVSDLSPITNLHNLKHLNTYRSLFEKGNVKDLSPLKNLVHLQTLNVSWTKVVDISPLKALLNLQVLNISYTDVKDLSPLKNLKGLQELNASHSKTKDLSPLNNLRKLQKIDVSHSEIFDLSPILQLIKKGWKITWNEKEGNDLNEINVKDCPLAVPPPKIVRQGNKAILRYFEQLSKEGTDQIFEAKLLLIGEGGAGKTSLCHKLIDPEANLPKEKDSTQGIDIRPLYFPREDGRQFRLNIWDFAGQGKYQAAHSFFYTHRSLYILVDDTRTLDENEGYKAFYNYWLQTAELFGGDSPLLVLHNQKADRSRIGFNLGVFQIDYPFVKELFRINLGGDDMSGLLDLKRQIERWAQKLPHIGDVVPKTWVWVREKIEKERLKQRPYISDERYREICASHGITDEAKQSDLSRYFHDLGVFLHFQENPLLRRDVFLQNEWVTNAVYKILDDREIAEGKRGRFDKEDLARLWNDGYYAKRRDELLALMLQFELCYQVQDSEIYVAPQLLPGDIPKYDLGPSIPLQLKYEYGFMPKGLLYRLIVRLHRHIAQGQSAVWNSGVVLERGNGAQAEIIESLDRRQISIRATGARAKELVTIVNEEVEKLHDTYGERLKVEVRIPCNCDICKVSPTPHFYDKKDLDNRLAKGKTTVECRVSFDYVNVQGLLDGVFMKETKNEWATSSHTIAATVRQLVEQGETRQALETYKAIDLNKATVLLGKLTELNKQYPTLAGEEFLREKTKIDAALLHWLEAW